METSASRRTRPKKITRPIAGVAATLAASLLAGAALTTVASSPASAAAAMPDLVVTSVAKPSVAPGAAVKFSATVKNQGGTATPAGTIIGVRFTVDGNATPYTWSANDTASLAPGASVTLTANGGSSSATWPATAGNHTVNAFVDDVNRITESNESNNQEHVLHCWFGADAG